MCLLLNLATSRKKTTEQLGNDVAAIQTFVLKTKVTLGKIGLTIELRTQISSVSAYARTHVIRVHGFPR